jgi:hypothetical protein
VANSAEEAPLCAQKNVSSSCGNGACGAGWHCLYPLGRDLRSTE